jgi:hypothetical protein
MPGFAAKLTKEEIAALRWPRFETQSPLPPKFARAIPLLIIFCALLIIFRARLIVFPLPLTFE